jgi:hypothetical protein
MRLVVARPDTIVTKATSTPLSARLLPCDSPGIDFQLEFHEQRGAHRAAPFRRSDGANGHVGWGDCYGVVSRMLVVGKIARTGGVQACRLVLGSV